MIGPDAGADPSAAAETRFCRAAPAAAVKTRILRVTPVAAVMVVLTNGPVFLFSKSIVDRSGDWEDPAVWPFFVAAALASAVLAATSRPEFAAQPPTLSQKVAATAIAWYSLAAMASALWSVLPFATAWRASVYAGLALLAWVIARLDSNETAAVLFAVAGLAVAGSLLLVALRPDLGIDSNGAWKGLYTNRNSLAPLAALGVLVGVRYVMSSDGWARISGGLLTALSLTALIGAGSRTAWLSMLIAVAAATVPVACRWAHGRWGGMGASVVLSAAAVIGTVGGAAALAAFWNATTFSQRRTMWSLVWDRVVQRPISGYGFFAFWDVTELLDHALLRRGSAHNSLMEVALGLGLIGTVPFAVIVALAARNAGLHLWRRPGADSWLWAAVVGFVLVENVTESFVLWFSYIWVLLMTAALRPPPPRKRGGPFLHSADAGNSADAASG